MHTPCSSEYFWGHRQPLVEIYLIGHTAQLNLNYEPVVPYPNPPFDSAPFTPSLVHNLAPMHPRNIQQTSQRLRRRLAATPSAEALPLVNGLAPDHKLISCQVRGIGAC
jgi:hypothetical protein